MTGRSTREARLKALTAATLVLLGVACTIAILVPAGIGWDFANFYDAGHRVTAGQVADLYETARPIAGHAPQGEMRFWSAPLAAVFLAPLSWLQPATALTVFKIQNTLVLLLALGLLYRHCRRFVATPDRAAFAAVFAVLCLIYQPFWSIYRVGGQTTPTVFLLLIVALFCHARSQLVASALLLTVVAIIKPTFATMLLFLAFASGVGFALRLIAAGAFGGLLSIAMLGWPIHRKFLGVLVEGSRTSRSWIYNSSIYVPFENFRLLTATGPGTARALVILEWVLRAAVVAGFVFIFRRSRREAWTTPARRHFEFLMAVCFWLLVSQLVWEHYLAALFLPLAYLVASTDALSRQARILLGATIALALVQNVILVQYVAAHVQIEPFAPLLVAGIVKAGPLLLLITFLWLHHTELFASYRAPAWSPSGRAR